MMRKLPSSLDAERSVLGSILIDNDGWPSLFADDFYHPAHRLIFAAMTRLIETDQPIDLVTLKEEIDRAGDLDAVGGPAYIASLIDGVPRSTPVEYYAQIVKEKATLRDLIASANKILANADEAVKAADLILDDAERDVR